MEVLAHSHEWNAGNMGCGELIVELSKRMRKVAFNEILLLKAEDKGAIEDIPAWCRMTGHVLAESSHPTYFIRGRRRNPE